MVTPYQIWLMVAIALPYRPILTKIVNIDTVRHP